jgi:Region found in RelA / SpoT proteins
VLNEADGSTYQPPFSSASSSPMLLPCNDRNLQKRSSRSAPLQATDPVSTRWPPWLPASCGDDSKNSEDAELDELQETIETEFRWIRYELLKRENFGFRDVRDISAALERVWDAHRNDPHVVLGMIDFLRLVMFSDGLDHDTADGGDSYDDDDSNALLTKDVIIASILHYMECIEARKLGLEDQIHSALFRTTPRAPRVEVSSTQCSLPPGDSGILKSSDQADRASMKIDRSLRRPNRNDLLLFAPNENDAARLIARGAARIKRAEVLAHVVLHRPPRVRHLRSEDQQTGSSLSAPLTRDEADRMRGLLLSVMDDWRSLALRCTACLYRLEGIGSVLATDDGDGRLPDRPPLVVQTAREAMYVYAPLAEQLGMHRLKSAIEQRAFAILYRRQHRAVSSLFREKGEAMQTLNRFLLSSISTLLREDEALMSQLEDLQITSRVKEPYSFWRKLLKARKKKLDRLRSSSAINSSVSTMRTASTTTREHIPVVPARFVRPSLPTSDLSIANVQDGIALRVVLKARKWSEAESDEDVQARERILCYYVQHLIRKRWPEVNPSRVKDYIRNPKPNGYQSLHHTSSMSFNGVDYFPFEVQIRSEDMHRIAEFGVAAHWDYKLLGHTAAGANESSTSLVPSLAPVAERDLLDEFPSSASSSFGSRLDELQPLHHLSLQMSDEEASPVVASTTGSYLDALVTAKDKVLRENVYVFLVDGAADDESSDDDRRRGSIVSLPPERSTVGDALRAMNVPSPCDNGGGGAVDARWDLDGTSMSAARNAVWKNGILADLPDKVENGDVLVVESLLARSECTALVYPEACG